MIQPFHLSFVVSNLNRVKQFYIDVLGCEIGRDNESWFDILFFGHQLTIHQSSPHNPAYTIDHFGPILTKADWLESIERCKAHGIEFFMQPTLKDEGLEHESGKFMIHDPAGNLLEFKFYQSFDKTFG